MTQTPSRKREAASTREDILAAARRLFTKKGFDATGVRDIAGEVGINVALVNRYFGSKEALFEEAVIEQVTVTHLLDEGRDGFGERMVRYMGTKDLAPDTLDQTLVFVRSIASPTVGSHLKQALEDRVVAPIADWLEGENRQQRAALIASEIIGFDMLRRVAGLSSLDPENIDIVASRLGSTLQAYVDDTTP
ncbi:MAG: TetR family transcriptional regulator [Pseudomonadota bacterium]|nr:TetR family transcriptional regulator [Pseudomonadota bacterium]